jgi:hypothetical protein
LVALLLLTGTHPTPAQTADQADLAQRIQQLTDAMAKTQAQVDESQRALDEMRKEITALKQEIAPGEAAAGAPAQGAAPSQTASDSAVQDLRERVAVVESQIATHEQSKVESESRYPVRFTGLMLMNGFVNSSAVDIAPTPTVAVGGPGSVGSSIRQTILGLDASGPHLFGARSFADLRMDFYGSPAPSPVPNLTASSTTETYPGYYSTNNALVRLRTVHAGLDWDKTQVYFSLDRPILNPDTPTSLTATAVPALAWSGNLWTWNPQAGVTATLTHGGGPGVQLQTALIDVGDAPLTPVFAPSGAPPATATPPSSGEQSQRPGVEARIALVGSDGEEGRNHIGVGGYFAPHQSSLERSYDSWAGTVDARLMLPARLQFSGSAYRGLALGGLGGGGYKDFAFSLNPIGGYYFRALDDAGGWAQLKEKVNERLEFNGAAGLDNVFAYDLERYYIEGAPMVVNLARNRTFTGNVIYSPSAYLLFSLEYRRLQSYPIQGAPVESDIIGIGAGYRF